MAPGRNSIWQIINHMINWRENVLLRVKGNVITTPDNNYFSEVADASEAAWQHALKRLGNLQKQWISFLKTFDETEFEKMYPNKPFQNYSSKIIEKIVLLTKLNPEK